MTRSKRFLEEINESVLLGDGAIGTALFARGAVPERGVEKMNILDPQKVLQLHKDYVAGGSRVIETNTFGANLLNLRKYGVETEKEAIDIIHAGAKLAREAAGDDVYVAGSVGPLPTQDGELLSCSEQVSLFTIEINALLESGADILMLESFSSLDELVCGVETARSISQVPIVAQAAFGPEKRTADGDSAEEVAKRCIAAGANIVGANCGYGTRATLKAIELMSQFEFPMSAYINAGFPERIEDRLVYVTSHGYVVQSAIDLVNMGVRLVGGCCGTDPEIIHQISEKLPQRKVQFVGNVTSRVEESRQKVEIDAEEPVVPGSSIIVELDPPRNLDVSPLMSAAKALKNAGASAISISDNPFASVRMDNLAVGGVIQRESSLPVILHMTGRDRNRIATQSTIMGAHMLGIRSLLCLTGDPVRMCEEPNTSGVFDLTSVGLVQMVSDFNNGRRGTRDFRTSFSIGVAFNPNVRTISGQIDRLKRKIAAGAHFVMTQPIFEESKLDILQQAVDEAHIDIPIYIGIMPIVSARNAEYLHNEIPGIIISEEIRKRISSYQEIPDQRAAGIEIASEFVQKLASRNNKFYFICPRNRVDMVLPLISLARK